MSNITLKSFLSKKFCKKVASAEALSEAIARDENLVDNSSPRGSFQKFTDSDEDDGYKKSFVGIDSLIGATKKLLAVNRGEAEPDDRDSLRFKRVLNVDDLLAERTRLDAGKLRNSIMFRLSKVKNLKHFPANAFDSYMLGHIVSNSLSLPSEEINPLYLLDQQSRLSVFGQGGINSVESTTKESQNVNPTQFGFIDPLASPDGMKAGLDTRLAYSTRIGKNDGRLYTKVKERKTGKYVWVTPDELADSTVAFPD